jgi:hypothetical protein
LAEAGGGVGTIFQTPSCEFEERERWHFQPKRFPQGAQRSGVGPAPRWVGKSSMRHRGGGGHRDRVRGGEGRFYADRTKRRHFSTRRTSSIVSAKRRGAQTRGTDDSKRRATHNTLACTHKQAKATQQQPTHADTPRRWRTRIWCDGALGDTALSIHINQRGTRDVVSRDGYGQASGSRGGKRGVNQ